jgi:hypothetical protein
MDDDLNADEANRLAEQLLGSGKVVEERDGGFLVYRPPDSTSSSSPEGMALPARELIGRGTTRREAIESARRAVKK